MILVSYLCADERWHCALPQLTLYALCDTETGTAWSLQERRLHPQPVMLTEACFTLDFPNTQ